MKVLEKGRPQVGWSGEFVCTGCGNGGGGCGAKLLVEGGDVFRTESTCRDETDFFSTFVCEACGTATDIERGKGPPTYAQGGNAGMRRRQAAVKARLEEARNARGYVGQER